MKYFKAFLKQNMCISSRVGKNSPYVQLEDEAQLSPVICLLPPEKSSLGLRLNVRPKRPYTASIYY